MAKKKSVGAKSVLINNIPTTFHPEISGEEGKTTVIEAAKCFVQGKYKTIRRKNWGELLTAVLRFTEKQSN